MQRPDFVCFHKPYGEPFYWSASERVSRRYSDDYINQHRADLKDITYADVTNQILSRPEPGKWILAKDMAKFIVKYTDGKPRFLVSLDKLKKMNHIFLIRSPARAVPSHYRLCSGEMAEITGFSYYDPAEAGYKELKLLFDHICEAAIYEDRAPLVIDAESLTREPEATLKTICKVIGAPWDERMLSWKSGRVEAFSKYPGFHMNAENSAGFNDISITKTDVKDLPDTVREAIAENMPVYEYLKTFVLKE